MLVPVVLALCRSRPAGLFRFRALDVLYGIVLGVLLRVAQGWIAQVGGGAAPFPSYPTIDGEPGASWWLTDVVAVVAIGPVVEEFFFRAVILVSVFTLLRRRFGHVAAGISAVLVSAAAFVMLHSLLVGQTADLVVATALLGAVCASLVMLTGRIWGAVLVHVIYNATYVLLALIGTFLA
jgi:membrane protease YdiL (CAAX protease family)